MSNWRKAEGMAYLKEGTSLNPEILKKAVKQAGFTPTWMEVRARGILMKKDNSLVLQIEDIPQEFILVSDKTKEIEKLMGRKIVVTGNIQEEKAYLKITVKRFGLEEK